MKVEIKPVQFSDGYNFISVIELPQTHIVYHKESWGDCWAVVEYTRNHHKLTDISPVVMQALKILPNTPMDYEPLTNFVKDVLPDEVVDEEVIFGPDLVGKPGTILYRSKEEYLVEHDIIQVLKNKNITKNSFVSNYPVIVDFKTGSIRIPKGSKLNHASVYDAHFPVLDSIRVIVSYSYCK